MIDKLCISGLSVSTRIGIHEWEQRISQQLVLDISIPVDISTCNNQLENTVDYDALCQCITTFVESNSFTLIETVAEKVASLIKDSFKITTLTLSVSKPHAIKNARNIGVTITR